MRIGWKIVAVRVLLVLLGLSAWYGTQHLIAGRPFSENGIGDATFQCTSGINDYFFTHRDVADKLLIASSFVIDLLGLYLLVSAIFGPSIRPFLGLLIVFTLRQLLQGLCALPQPPQMIWNDPGFPSVLVTYGTSTDLFFSGHTSIAVYGALELARGRSLLWKLIGIAIAVFEITTVLLLRAHYTMDVYAGIITALWVYSFIDAAANRVDKMLLRLEPAAGASLWERRFDRLNTACPMSSFPELRHLHSLQKRL